MRLMDIHIINHKSLKDVSLKLGEQTYTTLIGVNDAGKTTLLKSLELFFDDKLTIHRGGESSQIKSVSNNSLSSEAFQRLFYEKNLPSFEYNKDSVFILSKFAIEREYSVEEIDELQPSDHLQWVFNDKILNDTIYILKVFRPDVDEYYLYCNDQRDEEGNLRELWLQSQTTLKTLQNKHGIDDSNIRNQNSRGPLKNIERAKAIYQELGTEPYWNKYDFKKDRRFFPDLVYLDWKMGNEQIDQLVATALGPTVNQSVNDIQLMVNAKRQEVNDKANTTLSELYNKYSTKLPSSITGLSANVDISVNKRVTELFVKKITSDDKVHIEDQGDGIKRQISLGLIRAIAEDSIEENSTETKFIWCIDEPETHLYPQAQRDLATNLLQLSTANFQIIVSTHSLTFVDRSRLKDVHKVELIEGYSQIRSTNDPEEALGILGVRNSDFLFFDKFIAVEGPTEYHLLDHMYQLIYGRHLIDEGIKELSLGGKSNKEHYQRILEQILSDYKKIEGSVIYLLDKDTNSQASNVALIGSKADFEDSLSNDIWIKLLDEKYGVTITETELNAMRATISLENRDKKLYKMLAAYVQTKPECEAFLSSKGEGLARDLKQYITHRDFVPECIKVAFRAMHNES